MKKLVILLILLILISGCVKQEIDKGGKPSAPINQDFDSDEKLLIVGDTFDITLTVSAIREDYLTNTIIVSTLHDKIHSKYESPFNGNMLNFEDYFEIVTISDEWEREKITSDSEYEIVKTMTKTYSEIIEKGMLLINNEPAIENKKLMMTLGAKQKGKFGLVMSQMNAQTGFLNICVGDSLEEAKELCKEIIPTIPTSTREEAIETGTKSCLDTKGEWKEFSTSGEFCHDECNKPEGIDCSDTPSWSCDCGEGKCWDGAYCVDE